MMIGFAIMMWFAAIVLILTSVSLLKGHYSAMHGRTFERTSDKEGFAKALGRPILAAGIGIARAEPPLSLLTAWLSHWLFWWA
jgi:hypothetical protein